MDQEKIKQFYALGIEKGRLDLEYFKLEGIRTKAIITRYLTRAGMQIADIGGGAGFYTFWLHALGHKVSFIDLTPKNVAWVRAQAASMGIALEHCEQGDATQLSLPDNAFDVVLLLGPLYHLTGRTQRVNALAEAKRILKPGGVVLAAVISKYASLFDGFRRDLIADDRFEKILLDDLQTGVHQNPTENIEYFTTAFFHTPAEIRAEVHDGGLRFEQLIAIEGVGWLIDNLSDKLKDHRYWGKVENLLQRVEQNDDLMALSPHIMAVGRKPD